MRYVNTNFTTIFKEEVIERKQRGLADEETRIVDSNTYIGNMAAYGSDIASYPFFYKYNFTQNGNTFETDEVEIAPGQALSLTVKLYDLEGRICLDEDDAVCTL